MKLSKKIVCLLLVTVMMMAVATTAFAANDSITINNAIENETYKIYKLFDLDVNDVNNPTAYSYKINSAWSAFFAPAEGATNAGPGNKYVTINEAGYVTAIEDADAAALAKAAAKWASDNNLTTVKEITAGEVAGDDKKTTVAFTGLDNGYYLITSTLGTVAMTETTPDKKTVTIEEKNPEDTIYKEVKEDNTGVYGENNDAQVGQTVDFKSTATIYAHSRNVKIHDTMDAGLTFNTGSIKIYTDKGLTTELGSENYTIQTTPDDVDTFTIQIADSYVDGLTTTSQTLYITYTAKLNEKAVVKDENGVKIVYQKNKTKITYGDKQSVEDETITTTHKFAVHKYDGADTEQANLAGATFKLQIPGTNGDTDVKLIKIDDNNYRVAKDDETDAVDTFTTVAGGNIVIWGVDSDNYVLEETKAPDGYNLLKDKVEIAVNKENSYVSEVANNTGTELPSTGGMGTTILYIVGGLLVVAAAVLLVTKKRVGTEK